LSYENFLKFVENLTTEAVTGLRDLTPTMLRFSADVPRTSNYEGFGCENKLALEIGQKHPVLRGLE
jgi:hypothetical protein